MKLAILLLILTMVQVTYAGTCTSISRTNASANSVLTSSKYNSDLNTSYSNQNNYDAGCIADGTLEDGALNQTDFELLLNYAHQGCLATKSDDDTISIAPCSIAINNGWVVKDSATTVDMGCGSCSAEVATQTYYVYALTTSASSTLNLTISTTAPDGRGEDGSGNKALARFYNNNNSNIETTVGSWAVNDFQTYPDFQIVYISDVKAAGTNGGSFTTGDWRTRDLNTVSGDYFLLNLTANQFTLPAGTYFVEGSAPANVVNVHKSRIYNITDSKTALVGSSEFADASGNVYNRSVVQGMITTTATKTFEFQHQCGTTVAVTGFGTASNYAEQEIYAELKITKLK